MKHIILAHDTDRGRKWADEHGLKPVTPTVWTNGMVDYSIVSQRHVLLGVKDAVFYRAGWVGDWLLDRAGMQVSDEKNNCRWATTDDLKRIQGE